MEDEKALTKAEIAVTEAFTKADSEDATAQDGRLLLALLQENPGALGFTVDMAESAIDVVIRQMKTSEANRALMHVRLERLRKSLGGAEASQTERLLIDQVVICYLRMNLTDQSYENAMRDGCSLAAASYWERKLSTVQYRYLRAIETLARVRKLMGVPREWPACLACGTGVHRVDLLNGDERNHRCSSNRDFIRH